MEIFTEEKYHITSLSKLFEIIDEFYHPYAGHPMRWIYRGHSDINYELLPGVGRLIDKEGYTVDYIKDVEQQAFQKFEIETFSDIARKNSFMNLAIAQHHGLKTRLLDWTFSPLVALFFVVEKESDKLVDGAFYTYSPERAINILNKNEAPFIEGNTISKYQYLIMPPVSPRIKAQDAIFQWFKNPTEPILNLDGLKKFIIPAKSKANLKADLFNINISYKTLFPDLDGLAKELNHIYFYDDYFKK